MSITRNAVSPIAAALNDPRAYIGNPWRNTHYVRLDCEYGFGRDKVCESLSELGIKYSVSLDKSRQREVLQIWIHGLEGQQKLLESVGDQFEERRRHALDRMVRARGPVPDSLAEKIKRRYERLEDARRNPNIESPNGDSFQLIADELNDKQIVDGMGGKGWTAQKVKRVVNG